MALVGTVFFGIFIGMVTESVESAIANADNGFSKVVASNHILLCGWNSNSTQIIRDLNAVGTSKRIVILVSPSEKEELMEELRDVLSDQQKKKIRISVRTGTPVFANDLNRVAALRASKIILVSPKSASPGEADRRVLSRALALRSAMPFYRGDIVAELSSTHDGRILHSILRDTLARSVATISSDRLLYRFMAQAVRQRGLADCVAQMMGENPRTVFHFRPVATVAPNLVGVPFKDLRPTTIPGAIVCGYIDDSTGKVVIGTTSSKDSPVLSAETQLLLLGMPSRSQAKIANIPESRRAASSDVQTGNALERRKSAVRRMPENVLVCGWRPDSMDEFLNEMDSMLTAGSKVTILDEDAPEALSSQKFKNISVVPVKKKADKYENLAELLGGKSNRYDHILILSSALGTENDSYETVGGGDEDSRTLSSLCYINELLKDRADKGATSVTIEFLNQKVAQIAKEQKEVTNAILPHALSAHISAQAIRDDRLGPVWSELLSQEGREVYLRPASLYINPDMEHASFINLADKAATERDEILIGYIDEDGDTVINPSGPSRFQPQSWSSRDLLITLANE